jgi:DNA invertase Pin-like site-specific DNA recombinase
VTTIGYARVSTYEQGLDVQIAALKGAACDVVRAEKRSGGSTAGRDELRTILDFIRRGDLLVGHAHRPAGQINRGPPRHRSRA